MIGENNLNLALLLRKEGQIALALKFLLKCAENGNSAAMFHLGYGYQNGGWGLREFSFKKGALWLKKSAENGHAGGMALHAGDLLYGFGIEQDISLSKVWGAKALSSKDSFAMGYYLRLRRFEDTDSLEKSYFLLEISACEGNEFAQFAMGRHFEDGDGVKKDMQKALYWYLRAAENCLYVGQYAVARIYRYGLGCEVKGELADFWSKKAVAQQSSNYLV